LLAGFHLGGAALGLGLLPFVTLPSGWSVALLVAPYRTFLGASAWTGYLLWQTDPRGRTWSKVLLGLQVPYIATPAFTYSLYGPLAIVGTVKTDGNVGIQAALETQFTIELGTPVAPSVLGLNLVAAGLLWLWFHRKATSVPTSGGLVTR